LFYGEGSETVREGVVEFIIIFHYKYSNCLRYSPSSRRLELLRGTKGGICLLGELSRNQTTIIIVDKVLI